MDVLSTGTCLYIRRRVKKKLRATFVTADGVRSRTASGSGKYMRFGSRIEVFNINNAESMFCLGNAESVGRRRDLTFGCQLRPRRIFLDKLGR